MILKMPNEGKNSEILKIFKDLNKIFKFNSKIIDSNIFIQIKNCDKILKEALKL